MKELVLIFIFIHICLQTQGTKFIPCDERRLNCCVGYVLEGNGGNCVKCPVGFVGPLCQTPCPFPFYGQFCQSRCNCEHSECNNTNGCFFTKTTGNENVLIKENNGISTIANEDTPPRVNRTKVALFEDNVGVDLKNGYNPILIGIFAFNAFFVMVIFFILMYCGIKKYRKHNRNKKDNSAIAVQYNEIDEGLAVDSSSYRSLHTIEETEVQDKASDDVEMGRFPVTYENEPLNEARQSSVIPSPPYRASQTMPKDFYPINENLSGENKYEMPYIYMNLLFP